MIKKFRSVQKQAHHVEQVPYVIQTLCEGLNKLGYDIVSHSVWIDYHSPSNPMITVLGEKNA